MVTSVNRYKKNQQPVKKRSSSTAKKTSGKSASTAIKKKPPALNSNPISNSRVANKSVTSRAKTPSLRSTMDQLDSVLAEDQYPSIKQTEKEEQEKKTQQKKESEVKKNSEQTANKQSITEQTAQTNVFGSLTQSKKVAKTKDTDENSKQQKPAQEIKTSQKDQQQAAQQYLNDPDSRPALEYSSAKLADTLIPDKFSATELKSLPDKVKVQSGSKEKSLRQLADDTAKNPGKSLSGSRFCDKKFLDSQTALADKKIKSGLNSVSEQVVDQTRSKEGNNFDKEKIDQSIQKSGIKDAVQQKAYLETLSDYATVKSYAMGLKDAGLSHTDINFFNENMPARTQQLVKRSLNRLTEDVKPAERTEELARREEVLSAAIRIMDRTGNKPEIQYGSDKKVDLVSMREKMRIAQEQGTNYKTVNNTISYNVRKKLPSSGAERISSAKQNHNNQDKIKEHNLDNTLKQGLANCAVAEDINQQYLHKERESINYLDRLSNDGKKLTEDTINKEIDKVAQKNPALAENLTKIRDNYLAKLNAGQISPSQLERLKKVNDSGDHLDNLSEGIRKQYQREAIDLVRSKVKEDPYLGEILQSKDSSDWLSLYETMKKHHIDIPMDGRLSQKENIDCYRDEHKMKTLALLDTVEGARLMKHFDSKSPDKNSNQTLDQYFDRIQNNIDSGRSTSDMIVDHVNSYGKSLNQKAKYAKNPEEMEDVRQEFKELQAVSSNQLYKESKRSELNTPFSESYQRNQHKLFNKSSQLGMMLAFDKEGNIRDRQAADILTGDIKRMNFSYDNENNWRNEDRKRLRSAHLEVGKRIEEKLAEQGWIGEAWDGFKIGTGIGTSSLDVADQYGKSKTPAKIMELKDSLSDKKYSDKYEDISGRNLELDRFVSSQGLDLDEMKLTADRPTENLLADYVESQENAVETVKDGAACAAGIIATPAGGIVVAVAAGALARTSLGASDGLTSSRGYSFGEGLTDLAKGGVSGGSMALSVGGSQAATKGLSHFIGKSALSKTAQTALIRSGASAAGFGIHSAIAPQLNGAIDGRYTNVGDFLKDSAKNGLTGAVEGALVGGMPHVGGLSTGLPVLTVANSFDANGEFNAEKAVMGGANIALMHTASVVGQRMADPSGFAAKPEGTKNSAVQYNKELGTNVKYHADKDGNLLAFDVPAKAARQSGKYGEVPEKAHSVRVSPDKDGNFNISYQTLSGRSLGAEDINFNTPKSGQPEAKTMGPETTSSKESKQHTATPIKTKPGIGFTDTAIDQKTYIRQLAGEADKAYQQAVEAEKYGNQQAANNAKAKFARAYEEFYSQRELFRDRGISERQIDKELQRYPAESRQQILALADKVSGLASNNGLQQLANSLNRDGYSLVSEGGTDLNSSLIYRGKKGQINIDHERVSDISDVQSKSGKTPAMVLDQRRLQQIQSGELQPSKNIQLLYPEGAEYNINMQTVRRAKDMFRDVDAVLKQQGITPEKATPGEIDRAIKSLKTPSRSVGNMIPLELPSNSPATPRELAEKFNRPLRETASSQPVFDHTQFSADQLKTLYDTLGQNTRLYSDIRLNRSMQNVHKGIQEYARQKGISESDILYFVPEPRGEQFKSYGSTMNRYKNMYGIPEERIITGRPDNLSQLLPQNSGNNRMLVVLDDFSSTANSLKTDVYGQLRSRDLDTHIAFAPVISTDRAVRSLAEASGNSSSDPARSRMLRAYINNVRNTLSPEAQPGKETQAINRDIRRYFNDDRMVLIPGDIVPSIGQQRVNTPVLFQTNPFGNSQRLPLLSSQNNQLLLQNFTPGYANGRDAVLLPYSAPNNNSFLFNTRVAPRFLDDVSIKKYDGSQ